MTGFFDTRKGEILMSMILELKLPKKDIDIIFKMAYNDYATIITITKKRSFSHYNFIFFIEQDIIKVDYIYLALYESCSQL